MKLVNECSRMQIAEGIFQLNTVYQSSRSGLFVVGIRGFLEGLDPKEGSDPFFLDSRIRVLLRLGSYFWRVRIHLLEFWIHILFCDPLFLLDPDESSDQAIYRGSGPVNIDQDPKICNKNYSLF